MKKTSYAFLIVALVSGTAQANAEGTNDLAWRARVSAAIRSNTTFQIPPDLEGERRATFAVQLRPDCSLAGVRLRRSSGVPAWDQAAERGIQRTDPWPRPAEGSCPSDIEISLGGHDTEDTEKAIAAAKAQGSARIATAEKNRLASCLKIDPYVGMSERAFLTLCNQPQWQGSSDYGHTKYTHYRSGYARVLVKNGYIAVVSY